METIIIPNATAFQARSKDQEILEEEILGCYTTRMTPALRLMLEGLAVEAASTGSCSCSCKSAISVDEVRWSGPLELPPCRTAPLHCPVP